MENANAHAHLFEPFNSAGFKAFKLETYELETYEEAKKSEAYKFGLSSTVEDLKKFSEKDPSVLQEDEFYQYIAKMYAAAKDRDSYSIPCSDTCENFFTHFISGIIASGDMEKFSMVFSGYDFEILMNPPYMDRYMEKNLLGDIIYESAKVGLPEDKVLMMVNHLEDLALDISRGERQSILDKIKTIPLQPDNPVKAFITDNVSEKFEEFMKKNSQFLKEEAERLKQEHLEGRNFEDTRKDYEEIALSFLKELMTEHEGIAEDIASEVLLEMVTGTEAKWAAKLGYYQAAEYFLELKEADPLSNYDLCDLEDEGKNHFEASKWLLEHGVKWKKSMVGEFLCQEHLLNYRKLDCFEDKLLVNSAIDLLLENGVTTQEKVDFTKSNCNVVQMGGSINYSEVYEAVVEYSIEELELFLDNNILFGDRKLLFKTIDHISNPNKIKLLMESLMDDHGVNFVGGELALKVINRSTEVIQTVVDVMKNHDIKIRDTIHDEYTTYITNRMNKGVMKNCEGNRIIAEYAGIEGQVNWSPCGESHDEL